MVNMLDEPYTKYRNQIVDVKSLKTPDAWITGKIIGVDLATRSLEIETDQGTLMIFADVTNFVFHAITEACNPNNIDS